jgi:hypothetical protein
MTLGPVSVICKGYSGAIESRHFDSQIKTCVTPEYTIVTHSGSIPLPLTESDRASPFPQLEIIFTLFFLNPSQYGQSRPLFLGRGRKNVARDYSSEFQTPTPHVAQIIELHSQFDFQVFQPESHSIFQPLYSLRNKVLIPRGTALCYVMIFVIYEHVFGVKKS